MNNVRQLHFQHHGDTLTVIDDSGLIVYNGSMHTGGIGGKSYAELSRATSATSPAFPVGSIAFATMSGHFTLQMANGRNVPMQHSHMLSKKTTLASSAGELTWMPEGMLHKGQKLVDEGRGDAVVAHLGKLSGWKGKEMSKVELCEGAGVDSELMDEVVLSSIGVLLRQISTQKVGMAGLVVSSIGGS